MGQDGEEAAEKVATIRGEHVVMKTWFMGSSPEAETLRKQYGPYPGLWKEVLNWPGWKDARRAYLKHSQKSESGSGGGGGEAAATSGTKKRRSRWGTSDDSNNNNANGGGGDGGANKRRSRWGRDSSSSNPAPAAAAPPPVINGRPTPALPGLPGMPTNLAPQDQIKMASLQSRLRTINDKLSNLEAEAARVDALPRGHRERSPSPPPVYGADGKRKNTRAVRWRERYSAERQDILEELMSMNPATRKSGFFRRKRSNKIRIPVEQHPTYNFIGLIIGPRGKTQKELEAKTGCKIAIRGRGSVKEGARGRRDGKMMEGDNEPLHVVITGDDQKSVDAATDMINQMLVVIDDEKNVHKQQQLRELALLNGTLKEDEYCQICGERGHRSFECPKRFSMNKPSVTVKCAICGGLHPTRDCTQKSASADPSNPQELDSDYQSFMAELDGKKVEKAPPGHTNNPSAPKPPPAGAGGVPPAPPGGAAKPGLPPPPSASHLAPPPPGGPPPPPSSLPPPPPGGPPRQGNNNNYYGNQPHQQSNHQGYHQRQHYGNNNNHHYGGGGHHGGGGGGQGYHHQQQQQGHGHYQQPQQQHHQQQNYNPQQQQQAWAQQQQQQQQARPGDETQGWDPSAYYGAGGGGDAGGFNWWS